MTHQTIARLSALAALATSMIPCALANGEIVGIVESKAGKRVEFAVVSLENVSGNFTPGTVNMDQLNKEFNPHVLGILKGTTVRFVSSDPFFHNVFSSSRVKMFNVSQEKKGDVSTVTFDKVGIVPVRCHIHANMKAYIVVLANPYFGVSNANGVFKITGVPAGTYTIKVWGETFPSQTQSITVPASGAAKIIFKVGS